MKTISKQTNHKQSSGIVSNQSQELIRSIPTSPKRRVLISPSKDLMLFFDQNNFNQFAQVKQKKPTKKVQIQKLTLLSHAQKQVSNKENQLFQSQTKKSKNQNPKQANDIKSQTLQKNSEKPIKQQKLIYKQNLQYQQQRFQKLKKQVDLIRKKYSLHKNFRKSLDISFRNSTTNHTSEAPSLRSSLEKLQKPHPIAINGLSCHPQSPKQIGRKILRKKVDWSHKLKLNYSTSNLGLNTTQKLNLSETLRNRKKSEESCLFNGEEEDISLNINKNSQLFQFTFGNIALMEFKNNCLNNTHLKLKI